MHGKKEALLDLTRSPTTRGGESQTGRKQQTNLAEISVLDDREGSSEFFMKTHEEHRVQGVNHGHVPSIKAGQYAFGMEVI